MRSSALKWTLAIAVVWENNSGTPLELTSQFAQEPRLSATWAAEASGR